MVENTKIEWCTHTFNPWVGCTKVSPACDHCYAESWAKRTGSPQLWQGERRRTTAAYWQQPLKWDRAAAAAGRRDRVFCASLADVFDNQVPARWRDDLWHRIHQTPHLDWLLLTKRPQNIRKMLPTPAIGTPAWGDGWANVWLGTTVENQEEANRRIPHLLAVPAHVHFLSCEPLLGSVDLTNIGDEWSALDDAADDGIPAAPTLDWVIAGGESGHGARPMHPDWVRALRDQCVAAQVPLFFKQWGAWAACQASGGRWPTDAEGMIRLRLDGSKGDIGWPMQRVGKHHAGRLLDGRTWDQLPEVRS